MDRINSADIALEYVKRMNSSNQSNEIPCLVLAYHELMSLQNTLESLRPTRNQLSIHVIENYSSNTVLQFDGYMRQVLADEMVASWVVYRQNVSSNAILDALERNYGNWLESEYLIITDGDLIFPENWLEETKGILEADTSVFAVGVDLMLDNLPLNNFPDAHHWVPGARETNYYLEGPTGVHGLVLRSRELAKFLAYRQKVGAWFTDSALYEYCYKILRMKWARTRHCKARHITWDLYADITHPYTKMKLELMASGRCWTHSRVCPAVMHEKGCQTLWEQNDDLYRNATMKRFLGRAVQAIRVLCTRD